MAGRSRDGNFTGHLRDGANSLLGITSPTTWPRGSPKCRAKQRHQHLSLGWVVNWPQLTQAITRLQRWLSPWDCLLPHPPQDGVMSGLCSEGYPSLDISDDRLSWRSQGRDAGQSIPPNGIGGSPLLSPLSGATAYTPTAGPNWPVSRVSNCTSITRMEELSEV